MNQHQPNRAGQWALAATCVASLVAYLLCSQAVVEFVDLLLKIVRRA